MTLAAEQISKSLLRKRITVTVTGDGDLALDGKTNGLTDEDKQTLRLHKTDLVRYLTQKPLGPVALYVATDLEHWVTDEPFNWADTVTIHGKQFIRLTPAAVAWFRKRVARAEEACAAGKLPLDAFGRVVSAFCPIYEFAVEAGLIPDPVTKQVRRAVRTGAKGTSGGLKVYSPGEVVARQDFVGQCEKTGMAAAAGK